ncbi:hypothetical protein FA048_18500 [Pedobacter polaris]|uniref:Uncharacterized protein n=1 Tax=Pedobacter polaris TaxID=2571273 RepID=A0A4U1CK18_9SPHI|nr:hypothetical protein [Pedobacter polaris]TKC05703.1 hypothetical protein FA048_18500 [Pedobacter polaris]
MSNEDQQQKKNEFIIWILGMVGILIVIISRSKTGAAGFLNESYYAPILIFSMLLLCTSLFIKLKRESKKKGFSVILHTREIIRTVAGLGIAMYYLLEQKGF